ncbi:hypothetical protein SDC9_07828 [bioreactor metagenome]|uniref:Uncharacterized protein n=1 Tax=bioreactor metagenome TaxID=1076179 RepID=A0A644T7P4_9ZZZZ|nr:hypothetical protein [Candidatus Elulimicrobiales bacterium]
MCTTRDKLTEQEISETNVFGDIVLNNSQPGDHTLQTYDKKWIKRCLSFKKETEFQNVFFVIWKGQQKFLLDIPELLVFMVSGDCKKLAKECDSILLRNGKAPVNGFFKPKEK